LQKYFNLSAKAFVKIFKKYFNLTPKALVKIFEKVGRILNKIWEKILEHRATTDTLLHPLCMPREVLN